MTDFDTNRVAVLGAGSWGTALAWLVRQEGLPTALWARRHELAERVTESGENTRYLPGTELAGVTVSTDLAEVVRGVWWVVVAVPCAAVPELARALRGALHPEAM